MVMMWFFVHGSTVGETTGKPVGLVPFVVFVVAVLRRFYSFFRCFSGVLPSAAAVRPAAKEAAVIGFPYGILLHQFLLLPLVRVFFRFFFPSCCLWLVSCLSSSACRPPAAKSSSFTSGMAELAGSSFSLSLVLSRSSVVFSFPSSASLLQGGAIGVREGSKTLYSKIHLVSLSCFLYTGGASTSERSSTFNQAPLFVNFLFLFFLLRLAYYYSYRGLYGSCNKRERG